VQSILRAAGSRRERLLQVRRAHTVGAEGRDPGRVRGRPGDQRRHRRSLLLARASVGVEQMHRAALGVPLGHGSGCCTADVSDRRLSERHGGSPQQQDEVLLSGAGLVELSERVCGDPFAMPRGLEGRRRDVRRAGSCRAGAAAASYAGAPRRAAAASWSRARCFASTSCHRARAAATPCGTR
jgi:hypothetical protein